MGILKIMQNKIRTIILAFISIIIFVLFGITAYTEVRLNTIPAPPVTTKLRIAKIIITGPPLDWWPVKHEDYVKAINDKFIEVFNSTGIKYEIISPGDMEASLEKPESQIEENWWLNDNCDSLKRLGKKLYADYVIIISRTREAKSIAKHKMILVNIITNAQYLVSSDFAGMSSGELNLEKANKEQLVAIMLQKIFADAKLDLNDSAIRKGQNISKIK